MSAKAKKTSLTKYVVAAVAAVLVIGITVSAVMIKAHKKNNIIIENVSKDSSEESSKAEHKTEKKTETAKEEKPKKTKTTQQTTVTTETTPVTTAVSFPIDINLADEQQLCEIDGIGPTMAKRILEYRRSIGKFGSLEQLLNVEGIGTKTFQKISGYLFVSDADKSVTASTTVTTTKKASSSAKTAVRTTTASSQSSVTSSKAIESLNINTATADEFAEFFGISKENAQKLVNLRTKIHGFTAKSEILIETVVSEDKFNELEDKMEL